MVSGAIFSQYRHHYTEVRLKVREVDVVLCSDSNGGGFGTGLQRLTTQRGKETEMPPVAESPARPERDTKTRKPSTKRYPNSVMTADY